MEIKGRRDHSMNPVENKARGDGDGDKMTEANNNKNNKFLKKSRQDHSTGQCGDLGRGRSQVLLAGLHEQR